MLTKVLAAEGNCGTDAAGASTFGSATVVRVVNSGTTNRLVTIIDEVGGSTTIGSFTLVGSEVAFVEKKSTEAIFAANASVKGSKVAYAN